ncbi:hypothetical protein AYI68_g1601 [Smittium mucronatum]|uniref:Uncharacterized protein n=1 Tax=Smittium mucronatum TaxID=133383 RepID=A0A1R0H524_9FUNG|nr:hypothetical protein AYI68_g1601 [Smittium mucronatum]
MNACITNSKYSFTATSIFSLKKPFQTCVRYSKKFRPHFPEVSLVQSHRIPVIPIKRYSCTNSGNFGP